MQGMEGGTPIYDETVEEFKFSEALQEMRDLSTVLDDTKSLNDNFVPYRPNRETRRAAMKRARRKGRG